MPRAAQRQPRDVRDVQPANVTDSASRLSRLPWQTGSQLLSMYCATRRFIIGALRGGEGVQHVLARAVNVPM